MKRFTRIKAVVLTFVLAVAAAIPLLLTGCKEIENGTIIVSVNYKLYDCDNNGDAVSDTPKTNRTIKVNQYYKVVFDINFDDLASTLQDDEVSVTMTVNLGSYENETNKTKLLGSEYYADVGLDFTEKDGQGNWETTFGISKRNVPDFSKCYFIIFLQSMGTSNGGITAIQDMKVGFSIADAKSKRNIQIKNVGAPTAVITLNPTQGDMFFTYADNVTSSSTGINSIEIAIPVGCVDITAEVYFDSSKSGTYGSKKYDTFEGSGTNKKLTINLSELMIDLTDADRFNQLMNQPSPSIYVVLTSNGGRNYNTVSFGFLWELKG